MQRLFRPRAVIPAAALLAASLAQAAPPAFTPRWQLDGDAIRWQVKDVHRDQLEMSGRQVSAVIDYGSQADGSLLLARTVVWPMLRTIPDDTHASLIRKFGAEASPAVTVDGQPAAERLQQVRFDGRLALRSQLAPGLALTRTLTPSPGEPALVERLELANTGAATRRYSFSALERSETTPAERGTHGAYVIEVRSPAREGELAPGARVHVDVIISGRLQNEMVYVDGSEALQERARKVAQWRSNLVLETPEPVLDAMFAFAKVRAAESIFATRGGLLHGPGGTRYYAAVWANDQAEYINPFFPYLGDSAGVQSALTSFGMFARYMNADYKPIPSSIIAEGRGYWNGAGDRGDCAMISYGASQFALAQGDSGTARQLLPLIDWCLEFTRRKRDAQGIVQSDSDELEGRFPAGKANLSTNVLAYGGLQGAARLAASLGDAQRATALRQEAESQRGAIERYFGARMDGFETYRYYDGNEKLRAWIALPLALGINERQRGTVDALLSPQLWSENGVLTEAGDKTFWDRATLYALRGLLKAGELERTMPYLRYYSSRRLLGEHVPYAVEAWPEGQQRHLSAESGLYARVVTEGLFGIEATSLRSFTVAPRLPQGWPRMALRHMRAFGAGEDGDGIDIVATRTPRGQRVLVRLDGQPLLDQAWDGKAPLLVTLPDQL
ncbi:hypothetical protein [Duganella sp. Root198D2]|uniref:hypothetical protein n=1 Tax=Duganella sp. Root198D2 TaxID=1736489 RepID=UPI00070F41CC|nr:hypothetical protein [Duganella sp. Root198D2]KRC00907.1 hypothetical protein ASE26_21550 [Duganella sp. Root198D2]